MKKLLAIALLISTPAFGATKFYLHNAASDVSGYLLADYNKGSSLKTAITNTTSGGTDIEVTQTAGGTVAKWLTAPLSVALTISGSATCNVWGLESNGQANASFRCRYFKYSGGSEGSQIYIAQAPGELTTSATVKSIAATPTSTAFAAGDRIAIHVYLENCSATSGCPTGTMGASRTVTLDYDAATTGADGDSYLQITENEGIAQSETVAATLGVHVAAVVQTPAVPVTVADTFGIHCPVCFKATTSATLGATLGLHDAVSVSQTNNSKTVTAANTLGVSPAVICCQSIPFTEPTLGLSPAVAITDFRHPAVTATLGLSPALSFSAAKLITASATLGLHDAMVIHDARAPAIAQTLGISTSPFVLVSHSTSLTLTDTRALHLSLVAAQSIHPAYAATFGMHIAMTSTHLAPRAVTATLGLHDVAAVRDTAVTHKSETLGLHVVVSVIKNAVSNTKGVIVVIT